RCERPRYLVPQSLYAAWNVGVFLTPLETVKPKYFLPLIVIGSGKFGTPCARMHRDAATLSARVGAAAIPELAFVVAFPRDATPAVRVPCPHPAATMTSAVTALATEMRGRAASTQKFPEASTLMGIQNAPPFAGDGDAFMKPPMRMLEIPPFGTRTRA